MRKLFIKHSIQIIAVLITATLGMVFIGQKNFHLDEMSSIVISQDGHTLFTKLWNYEGNMWLYYGLLHAWLKHGTNETFVRLLSVIFGVLTIFPFYALTKKMFNKKTAVLATLLLPFQMLFVKNMQYARGYSLQLFLTVFSTYLFVQLVSKKTILNVLLYSIISALAVYTHIYSILVIAAHGVYILSLRDKTAWKWMVPTGVLIAGMVAPLLLSPAMKSGQINWIVAPDAYSLAATLVMLTGDFIPLSILIFIVGITYLFTLKAAIIREKKYVLLVSWISVPLIFSFLFSYFIKPIYNLQYFTIILAPVIIFTAEALLSIKKKKLFIATLSVVFILSMVRLGLWYSQTSYHYMAIPNQNAPWTSVISYIGRNEKPGDGIIVFPTYTYTVYDYYATKPSIPLEPLRLLTGYSSPFNNQLLESVPASYNRIWYIYNERADAGTYQKKKEIESFLSHSYKISKKMQWYELQVTLYTK